MSTSTATQTPGLLSVVERDCALAEQALADAHTSLSALPVIFEEFGNVANRGPRIEKGKYDSSFWGVSETSVRRYRLISQAVELGWSEGFNLFSVRQAVSRAWKATGVTADAIRDAIALADSTEEAVVQIDLLVSGQAVESPVEDEAFDEDEIEDEGEVEASSDDQVLRWLTAPAGPLRKALEAVQNGHVLNDAESTAFETILDIASRISGARSFRPVGEVVNA